MQNGSWIWSETYPQCKPPSGSRGQHLLNSMSSLLCAECMCYPMGTAPQACSSPHDCQCDQLSGQCPCQPNVVGQNCDRCAADTWNIASGTGCQRCDCDPDHSYGSSCNEVSQNLRRKTRSTTFSPSLSLHHFLYHCINAAAGDGLGHFPNNPHWEWSCRAAVSHCDQPSNHWNLFVWICWYMDSSCLGISSLSLFFFSSLFQSCTLKHKELCAHTLTQTFGFLCLLAALHQRKEVSEYTEE